MDSIRIEISGNADALQPTVNKLAEIGAIDKKNAEQFKVSNQEYIVAAKKREKILEEEKQDLIELQKLQKLAHSPEDIRQYEQSIKSTQDRIRLLSLETQGAGKSMATVVTNTNALGESVKKSYGFLRLAANIIPGLGISGLILAGYEVLASLLGNITDGFNDYSEAVEYNNEVLDDQIKKQETLQGVLQTAIQQELLLKGQISDADKDRFKTGDDYAKRQQEIDTDKLKRITELATKYKMTGEEFKKYSENIAYFGQLNKSQIEAVSKALDVQGNEGLPRDLDKRKQLLSNYYDKIQEYAINSNAMTLANEEALNTSVSNIESGAYKKSIERHRTHTTRKKEVEDEWWKWYLRMWEKNFNELLHQYKKDADDFIKENDRKFKDAEKRSEENTALIIEDMQIEASMTKDKTDDENAAFQERLNNRKKVFDEEGHETKQSLDHLEELVKQHNYNLAKIQDDADKEKEKKRKEDTKKAVDQLKVIADFALKAIEDQINANIKAIDRKQDQQKDAIEWQRRQAELGHDNTLAFEEKQQADLEKQRMNEQKKLIKLKELETFMNSIASFSKDDPKSAVAKALAQLAIVKGVEATFMEEGGLIGAKDNQKSWLGRTHKGGGDVLVHAQTGEGMFSRSDISNMGGEQAFLNFKNMLSLNKLPAIPMNGVVFQGMDTKRLEDKLDNLEKAFKNKKEVYVDWESHGAMNVTTVENGIRESVKHILRKPRI